MSVKKDIMWRIGIVYLGLLLLGLIILGQAIKLQFFQGSKWREEANEVTYKRISIESSRGDILAVDGRILATSIPYYEVRMDLNAKGLVDSVFNSKVDSLSRCLSNLFKDKSAVAYRNELEKARREGKRYYAVVPRRVNYLEMKQIKAFPLFSLGKNKSGLILIEVGRRLKPNGVLAARTIGAINAEGYGVGVEYSFDKDLKGTEGVAMAQRVAGSTWIPLSGEVEVEPKDGLDVVSTLDINLQDVAQSALYRSLEENAADHGTAVLMEVATGEIRAIANLKRNPDGSYSENYNYAVGESVEPGSTFKIPSLVCMLEDGLISLDEKVDTEEGEIFIHNKSIKDSKHEGGHGVITAQRVFEVSSNVGVVKLINKSYKGREAAFIDRLYSMKLDEKVGFDIKGEVKPSIKYPTDRYWSGVSLSMMSMGYEVKLTPLQMLTFYNAIANNGKMVRPKLVKELRLHGNVVRSFPPEVVVPSIASKNTLDKVRRVLQGVVDSGTATNLRNPNFKIAGKTGTAQIAQGSRGYGSEGRRVYQASFVGYFPANNPKYSCIVVINSPSKGAYYAALVAGPVFKEIADRVYSTSLTWHKPLEPNGKFVDLPHSKSGDIKSLTTVLDGLKIPYRLKQEQNNGYVAIDSSSAELLLSKRNIAKNIMPDVANMGIKDALFLLENAGLKVAFKGKGHVKKQSIAAGEKISRGQKVYLEMSM
ncbi:penicillin-binding protein [uncultured Acetobacteroides sp.]|uniref:penicillin-binding protein n=1 Tax=uncultured Acetobacteroides sp. TaxID=1760811 RepID=UPI0029F476D5|nr:penicillin-binding protein [uncultured Acetobacteroides sp.]